MEPELWRILYIIIVFIIVVVIIVLLFRLLGVVLLGAPLGYDEIASYTAQLRPLIA